MTLAAGQPRLRIHYPADLPVSDRRDDIIAALRDHQVVVVAGETGSGKTTQLPKMLLESLRGERTPRIAHTQPRRIAARAVAERLADELGTPLGTDVGYRVRFTDRTSDATAITVMTDGVLLASIRRDRLLQRYDAIIIDEAHERSLNIDFLLGYLAWLLPQRPELRVIITSATLDTQRFADHFGAAPVITVEGRTHPVEVRYRPAEDTDDIEAICAAVDELLRDTSGDILVFLTGEREIRDAAEALAGRHGLDVVPLYGRLSSTEQHRVFAPHDGRRVVLATNVAETSLTVPGIRSVIDTGRVRLSRFSSRLRVQRLPIEPISQASAAQRAGRCGRLGPGVCIRLYSESDLQSRPAFTDPEILRTNLASVLLSMATLDLGDVADFPFIDPPDRRAISAGIAILEEVGALRAPHRAGEPLRSRVTSIGRRLVRLPIDPRLGRMVLQAQDEGCLDDVIIIAAALAIRDPRERPAEHTAAADAAHRRFIDPTSDLLTLLNLWDHLERSQARLSSTRFRTQCRSEFIHHLRVREWQDLVAQIRGAIGNGASAQASSRHGDAIHRAVLSGLLSHIGMRAPADDLKAGRQAPYLGTRGSRFSLWPGSALVGAKPDWVVAAELVDTGRLWGRMAARIDPTWIEPLAGSLAQRSHSEPIWSPRQARAQCVERVTVLGLPVVTDRRIPFDRIDPEEARRLFILHALVRNEWRHNHTELIDNAHRLNEAREQTLRARIAVDGVDEDALVRFFDNRIPDDITSGRAFDAWWRRVRQDDATALSLDQELLDVLPEEADFPGAWPAGDWPLSYRFSPGDPRDGVTVHLPVAALASLPDDTFIAQVPGYREDLLIALLRALPKSQRKAMGPAPEAARALLHQWDRSHPRPSLSAAVSQRFAVNISPDDWPFDSIPGHLRPTISVEDDAGQEIAVGKDLADLRRACAQQTLTAIRQTLPHLERNDVREWLEVPREVLGDHGAVAYPGLVATSDGGVGVRVFPGPTERDEHHERGAARLLCIVEPLRSKDLRLPDRDMLVLARNPQGSVRALLDDARCAVAHTLMDEAGGSPVTAEEFAGLRERFRMSQSGAVGDMLRAAVPVLEAWWTLEEALSTRPAGALAAAYDDASAQLMRLMDDGFLVRCRNTGLPDLLRYLRALERRMAALPHDAARDLLRMEQVHKVEDALDELPVRQRQSTEGRRIESDIQELRVSLWAQDLGTRDRVSQKRLLDRIAHCGVDASDRSG